MGAEGTASARMMTSLPSVKVALRTIRPLLFLASSPRPSPTGRPPRGC
jgi:hypothetical protein